METFAPEFSRYWLPNEVESERRHDAGEDEVTRQQKALEELAERVTAARTII